MNLLMVHPHDLFLTSEPWTIRIKKFAEELSGMGHHVRLVHFPNYQEREFERVEKEDTQGYEAIAFTRNRWSIMTNTKRMLALAKWADVVHFQKCFPYSTLPALLAAYICGKPVHYDWDDWEYQIYQFAPPSRIIGWYLNLMEMLLPRVVDSVSVASLQLRRLCRKIGFDDSRIFETHVGADLDEFSPAISGDEIRARYGIQGPIVIYVGQLHSGQYIELFISAARDLKETNICFLIVGGGYALHHYLDVAKDLVDIGKIIFTGFVTRDEVRKYVAAADVAVACFEDNNLTRSKSPLKIAEYLAAGKAIVASDVGEVKRMLGDSGMAVTPGDPHALARGILHFIENKNDRIASERKARKRAETIYNWHTPAKNLHRAYTMLTGKP